jgi:hypothetical protein
MAAFKILRKFSPKRWEIDGDKLIYDGNAFLRLTGPDEETEEEGQPIKRDLELVVNHLASRAGMEPGEFMGKLETERYVEISPKGVRFVDYDENKKKDYASKKFMYGMEIQQDVIDNILNGEESGYTKIPGTGGGKKLRLKKKTRRAKRNRRTMKRRQLH